jgi:hypothetical protein
MQDGIVSVDIGTEMVEHKVENLRWFQFKLGEEALLAVMARRAME